MKEMARHRVTADEVMQLSPVAFGYFETPEGIPPAIYWSDELTAGVG